MSSVGVLIPIIILVSRFPFLKTTQYQLQFVSRIFSRFRLISSWSRVRENIMMTSKTLESGNSVGLKSKSEVQTRVRDFEVTPGEL